VSGWRTALRVARREARRNKGRSILVVAMIMLPVFGLSFAAVDFALFALTPQEQADRSMGTAQATIRWQYDGSVRQEPDLLTPFPDGAQPTGEPPPTVERLLGFLPAGTRAVPDRAGALSVRTASGVGSVDARRLDYTDPLAQGILRQVSGRAPAADDEVALTASASKRIGAGVDGTVKLADDSRTFRVVGIVEDPTRLDVSTIVVRADVLPLDRTKANWLVGTPGPLTWAQVKDLNKHGMTALSRHVLANPPSAEERYTTGVNRGDGTPAGVLGLVAGLAMLEIVLLAGPAFAVGARRRRRDLALVAASGGTPAQVRRIVLADGVVLGAVAAISGVVLGVVAAAATRPIIEVYNNSRSGAFRVFPEALALLACLAVVTGVLAALVPAWTSSRQDVVIALTGRRGITRSKRRWLVLGLALIAAGVAVAAVGAWQVELTVILGGVVIGELGLVLCTPAIVGLVARLGRWLPLPLRIALRDTSRNRTAAAPAISAVMAVVIGSLAISVVMTSEIAHDAQEAAGKVGEVTVMRTGNGPGAETALAPDTVTLLRNTEPIQDVHEISLPLCDAQVCILHAAFPESLACPYTREKLNHEPTADEQRAARQDTRCDDVSLEHRYFGVIGVSLGVAVVVEPAATGAILTEDAEQAATALRDGAVVVDDPRAVQDGRVTLTGSGPGGRAPSTVTARAVALPHRAKAPIALMTKETAASLGLGVKPLISLATTSRMPTLEEQDTLQATLGSDYTVRVERGAAPDTQSLMVLAIVAGVITIGAAALATGLAAADGKADLAMLGAVGASPGLRRLLSLSQSGVIAGLGSLLGAAAGLGASTAVLAALNRRFVDIWPEPIPFPIIVPWLNVAVALIVVPLVAMLGAGLLTRSRLPIERRL
jgi:putative ABC transport system permease protein